MKRGLTLLEVLLAVALLASLVVATTSWTTIAASFGTRLERALEQEATAEAFLRLVHDGIAAGDFTNNGDEANERPRVFIDEADGALVVRTRASGEENEQRFVHDAQRQQVSVNEQVILDDVAEADWSIDDERRVLTINLVLQDGKTASRRYVLP